MTTFQLYLAPLRGFTDYIYRNAFTGHFGGFDGALAPFIPTVTADRFKPSHFKDILPENNPTLPIVPQIIVNQAADFITLAERLYDLGYTIIKAGRDDISHKVEKFKQFYDELFEQYRQIFCGPGHLLNRMKGFWTYFSKSFQNSRNITKKVHRTQKMHHYMKIVDRFFAEEAQWKE